MSGDLTAEAIEAFSRKDCFAGYIGVELIEAEGGRARARLAIRDHHRNSIGLVHGGAIFTLADLAFAAAANSRGRTAVAIHCSISYVKAPQGDLLLAQADEVSCGSKIAAYTVRITDASGEVVALFEGMAYRKREQQKE